MPFVRFSATFWGLGRIYRALTAKIGGRGRRPLPPMVVYGMMGRAKWNRRKSVKIGNVEIDSQLVLAPMAGVTDLGFRTICRELGAGYTVTEMVSAKALCY